jgi:hypothetical protein
MNAKFIKLLASVCIGLCLVIAMEWLYANYIRYHLLKTIRAEKNQAYKANELPGIELTKKPEESYVDLVARPLFIKGRRPVEEPRSEAEQSADKAEDFDWQLSGVYSIKNTVSALFSRSISKVSKDNHRKITVGDDLDGWILIEINRDRAVLKHGSNEKELLLRKSKLKALPQGGGTPAPTPESISDPTTIPEPPGDAPANNTEDTSESNHE